MSETLHIKINIEEAINSKRNLLNSELNLLNIIKRIQSYKKLRTLELKTKSLLRTQLKKVTKDITEIKKSLPKTKKLPKTKAKTSIGIKARGKIESELRDIRDELNKLSR